MNQTGTSHEDETRVVYDTEDTFSTHDMGCSAALLAAGYVLSGLDKTNPRKALFVFSKRTGIEESAETYWSDVLHVPARTYFDTIKMLKNRLYSE
jgi:hypothetical protein